MVAQHYRWDFIGLSTDTKPTPATSEKVVDGSTFYCSDTSKLYVFYKDTWYEKTATGGGGGTTYTAGDGITIADDTIAVDLVQTTGDSTKKVMSQNAVSSALFSDPSSQHNVSIGNSNAGTSAVSIGSGAYGDGGSSVAIGVASNTYSGSNAVAIGNQARARNDGTIGIGYYANVGTDGAKGSVSIGAYSKATSQGEINIGSTSTSYGYNNTNYRLLSGVHDGSNDHDAVTVGQINALIDAINTATSSNISHIGTA